MPLPHLSNTSHSQVAIVGGGPAGLMAAEVIASAGFSVSIYDVMPSVGRKFLLAGVGGMNITHSEPHEKLLGRYGQVSQDLKPFLDSFCANDLRQWIHGLGVETFVGSSGRVFPHDMKAAPLLRAWLHRLRELGVQFYPRHRWLGWSSEGVLKLMEKNGSLLNEKAIKADALLLALGGASWQRLGSDGVWVDILQKKAVDIAALLPSNCGFEFSWSEHFQQQFSGVPLQTVRLTAKDNQGVSHSVRGEAMIVKTGIEGTSVYALSSVLRNNILAGKPAELVIDLLPDFSEEKIIALLNKPRGKNSISNFLRKQFNLPPVKLALIRELTSPAIWQDNQEITKALKCLCLPLVAFRPIDEAISSAGGVKFSQVDSQLMLKNLPGVFCAGEMLDWEAPTGGYLLTACFATGRAAGFGVVDYLRAQHE